MFAPGARRSVWCGAPGACTGGWLSGRGRRYLVTNLPPYLVRSFEPVAWAHINLQPHEGQQPQYGPRAFPQDTSGWWEPGGSCNSRGKHWYGQGHDTAMIWKQAHKARCLVWSGLVGLQTFWGFWLNNGVSVSVSSKTKYVTKSRAVSSVPYWWHKRSVSWEWVTDCCDASGPPATYGHACWAGALAPSLSSPFASLAVCLLPKTCASKMYASQIHAWVTRPRVPKAWRTKSSRPEEPKPQLGGLHFENVNLSLLCYLVSKH